MLLFSLAAVVCCVCCCGVVVDSVVDHFDSCVCSCLKVLLYVLVVVNIAFVRTVFGVCVGGGSGPSFWSGYLYGFALGVGFVKARVPIRFQC